MSNVLRISFISLLIFVFVGCGGGGSNNNNQKSSHEPDKEVQVDNNQTNSTDSPDKESTQTDNNQTSPTDKPDKDKDNEIEDGGTSVTPVLPPTPKTYKISGYVYDDPVPNAMVNLYDSKGQKILSTKTNSAGSYVFDLSSIKADNLMNEPFLYIEAIKNKKKLRGLILGFNKSKTTYSNRDVYLSHYSEALFQIKDALSLNRESLAVLYKNFINSYEKGNFKENKYYFAFTPIMEDIANNVKANFYQDKPLYTKDEIISKIKTLNNVDYQTLKRVKTYSFPLLQQKDDSITLQIVSFSDYNVSNSFSVDMDKLDMNGSILYDRATIANIKFSDKEALLKNVKIDTFNIALNNNKNFYSEEYIDKLKDDTSTQIIENKKLKLVLRDNNTKYKTRSISIKKSDLYWHNDVLFLKLVLDLSHATDAFMEVCKKSSTTTQSSTSQTNCTGAGCLDQGYTSSIDNIKQLEPECVTKKLHDELRFYISYKHDVVWNTIVEWKEELTMSNNLLVAQFDITDKIKAINNSILDENLYLGIWVNVYDPIDKREVKYERYYASIDKDRNYDNATIGSLALNETILKKNSINGDNIFINKKGHENEYVDSTVTHRIIDFDKIVNTSIQFNHFLVPTSVETKWKDTHYAKNEISKYANSNTDTRIPLLLIHGWQGGGGQTDPGELLFYSNNEFSYFQNLISYYLATPEIYKKYKLYTYHYPSYKHITFNARMLKKLFDERIDKNSILYKGYKKENGLFIIGHSMGGLISRSFIEEHKALGNGAENLLKLITLDTPHHGSLSSVTSFFSPDVGGFFAKNLNTPGAVDLIWDNYDKFITKNGTPNHYNQATDGENGDSRRQRMEDYDDLFDNNYIKKANIQNDLDKLNPYLYYLNTVFKKMGTKLTDKYIIYAALDVIELSDSRNNPVDGDNFMSANTMFHNTRAYYSGGAESLESALFSNTRITNYDLTRYIDYGKAGILGNYLNYRVFWDYNHETLMNGQLSKKIASNYIDKGDELSTYQDSNTYFADLIGWGTGYARAEYIKNALAILKGEDYVYSKDYKPENSKSNPLKKEPVFLVMKKDLMLIGDLPILTLRDVGIATVGEKFTFTVDASKEMPISYDIKIQLDDGMGDFLPLSEMNTESKRKQFFKKITIYRFEPKTRKYRVGIFKDDKLVSKWYEGTFGLVPDIDVEKMTWDEAVDYCKIRKERLPTKDELEAGFVNKGFVGDFYWSSNLDSSEPLGVYGLLFLNYSNIIATASKKSKNKVKCVSDSDLKPVATAQSVSVTKNTAKPITLSGTDADGNPLTYTITSQPSHGTLNPPHGTTKNVTYTPSTDYTGDDSFTFKVNDGTEDSDEATVSIFVGNINIKSAKCTLTTAYDNSPIPVPKEYYQKNGYLYVEPTYASEHKSSYYWTNYAFGIDAIDSNGVTIKLRFKSIISEGAISGKDIGLGLGEIDKSKDQSKCWTYCGKENSGVSVSLMGESWASGYTSGHAFENHESLYSKGVVDMKDWHIAEISIKDGKVNIKYDNSILETLSYDNTHAHIFDVIHFGSKGSAKLDWIKLYKNGKLVLFKDF